MRRTQEEMKEIRNAIILFVQENNGEASYGELFDFLKVEYNFNDSQLSSLLYRMSSVWFELSRPENGVYRLGTKYIAHENLEVKDMSNCMVNEINSVALTDKLSRDLSEFVDAYKSEVAKNLLTLTNDEIIKVKSKLKELTEIIDK